MECLAGIERVVKKSKHVKINPLKIGGIAGDISSQECPHWMGRCPIDLSGLDEEQKTAFLFTFNAISFSYWGAPKWNSGYERGTWSMINSLKKAIEDGKPILEPNYISSISREDLEGILQGNTRIPLLEERLRILRELGRSVRSYGEFVEDSSYDAVEFVEKLVLEALSFRDCSEYDGETVIFNKRAQLLASDLGHLLRFRNTDKLTACADYILPMVLRHREILVYSQDLAEKVDNKKEIAKDSTEEIEIRANTIWAVELIAKKSGLSAMQVNDCLWLAGDSVPQEHYYHRTRTTAY
jgi:hypothetical protein